MIRTNDISTFVLLTGAQETIDNIRMDVNLAREIEENEQMEQANITDNETYYLDCLQILHRQLDQAQDTIEMTLNCMDTLEKSREYQYLVGIDQPLFADQDYLRDKDEWIAVGSPGEAIKAWIELKKHWLQSDDRKHIKILDRKRVDAASADDDHDEELEQQVEQLQWEATLAQYEQTIKSRISDIASR